MYDFKKGTCTITRILNNIATCHFLKSSWHYLISQTQFRLFGRVLVNLWYISSDPSQYGRRTWPHCHVYHRTLPRLACPCWLQYSSLTFQRGRVWKRKVQSTGEQQQLKKLLPYCRNNCGVSGPCLCTAASSGPNLHCSTKAGRPALCPTQGWLLLELTPPVGTEYACT